MRSSDQKHFPTGIAILVTAFSAMVYTIAAITFGRFNILFFLPATVLIFAFVFFLLKYVIKKIIDESQDDVKRKVSEWSERQKGEIDILKEQAAYRREFLGNVSHELKTPIFNIQGYVLTLLDGGINDPSINKEYLIRTEKSINRMITVVEDLETISQLESATLNLDFSTFDIVSLSREIIEFMEIKAKKKKVSIEFDKNYNKPIMVKADMKRIRQVLINLFDNAIKYSNKADSFTQISFIDMDENVLIEVNDNGLGIDQENIPRIFERFFRTDKGRSREQGGSGLGLAIVKHIMEAHQQTINVRSTLGVGTTFGFTLKKV